MKKFLKEFIPYVIIIIGVLLFRTFIITPVRVDGLSMYPTLKDNEILLLKKYDKKYERFDIVVLNYNGEKLIKRIIGLPGEHLEYKDNTLYINGKKIKENFINDVETYDFTIEEYGEVIPKNSYVVLGDNREISKDSRIIGFINKKDIEGKVDFALLPFSSFGHIS